MNKTCGKCINWIDGQVIWYTGKMGKISDLLDLFVTNLETMNVSTPSEQFKHGRYLGK